MRRVVDTPDDTPRSLAARRFGLITLIEQVFEGGSGVGVSHKASARAISLLTPSPVGPLTLAVECRTDPNRRGNAHQVTIDSEWQVHTPHDLEGERIALAFGGRPSGTDNFGSKVIRHLLQALEFP